MCWGVGIPPHHRWLHLTLELSPQLTKEEETFAFAATQDFPVRNLQPATVTHYDYYKTGEPCQGRVPGVSGPAATPCHPDGLWGREGQAELSVHTDELWLINGTSSP